MDLNKALAFAAKKHEGQTRKDGTRYIYHPIAVAEYLKNHGFGINYQIAGLFHDLLEDTDATEDEILALSNEDVLVAVKLLTKGEDMASYIEEILENPIAKEVKNADRIHNLTDALNGKVTFARGYEKNTRQWYLGRFSKELDEKYEDLKNQIANYEYTVDASIGDASPLYRTSNGRAWVFNEPLDRWETTDPFFWAEIGDDATNITEKEAISLIGRSI